MLKQKIILTKGLPGSGKSTWAKDFVAKSNGKAKRVNKDDLRAMIDNSVYSKTNEKMILDVRDTLVDLFLTKGIETIIIDDTNFEPKHFERMIEIKEQQRYKYSGEKYLTTDITLEYKDFLGVPLEECIQRDAKRANPVGEKVIRDMYNRYIAPTIPRNIGSNKKGNTIIVDVDGTIAHNNGHRGWFEWSKVGDDEPIIPVINLVQMYSDNGYRVIAVSAREGTAECRELTKQWLWKYNVPFDELYMRPEKDFRKDDIIKEEIYNTYIKGKYDIEAVIDDRDGPVSFWRSVGLRCYQVAPGNF